VDRIENALGEVVYRASPRIACEPCEHPVDLAQLPQGSSPEQVLQAEDAVRGGPGPLSAEQLAPRVISAQNDYIMTDMMADVIKHGTGVRALALNRADIAGKTGTTNKAVDTWFNGFTPHLEATVWVGYDQDRPLGGGEEGARTALPIWIHFMREALKGVPQERRPMPDGIVTLRVSPQTGALVSAENPNGISEIFMADHLPAAGDQSSMAQEGGQPGQAGGEPIF
jgi:penicillin-binding protein 1A